MSIRPQLGATLVATLLFGACSAAEDTGGTSEMSDDGADRAADRMTDWGEPHSLYPGDPIEDEFHMTANGRNAGFLVRVADEAHGHNMTVRASAKLQEESGGALPVTLYGPRRSDDSWGTALQKSGGAWTLTKPEGDYGLVVKNPGKEVYGTITFTFAFDLQSKGGATFACNNDNSGVYINGKEVFCSEHKVGGELVKDAGREVCNEAACSASRLTDWQNDNTAGCCVSPNWTP